MRIALLSVFDTTTDTRRVPAPYRMLAGARLVERQLDMVLAAGCETVACLAPGVGQEVIALQHRAEEAGARFIALAEPRKLSGLVSAADELLVLAPGVLPDEETLLRHLSRPGVLVFPEETAVPRGYERIDARFAWSGALLVGGSAVERLAALPGDIDPPSALLRIALQSATRVHPLETRLLDDNIWLRDPTPQDLAAREREWVASHAQVAPFTAPGLAIAERIGARLARDAMGVNLSRALSLGAALAGTIALSLALAGWEISSFGFAALAATLGAMEEVVCRIALAGRVRPRTTWLRQAFSILLDPLLVVLIALASPEDTEWLRLFVPVVFFALLHLGERWSKARWRRSYADRVLITALLIPAAFFGVTQAMVAALGIAVLITLFLTSEPRD